MSKGIALIGVGETWWINELTKDIENGQSPRRIRWSYRIREDMESLMKKQINETGHLKILFYQSKKSGGDGTIKMIAYADDFEHINEGRSKSEFWVDDYEAVDPPMTLSKFWRLEDNRTVTPPMMLNSFAYVADVKEIVTKRMDIWEVLTLRERFLEDTLAGSLWLLGNDEFDLVDKQVRMGEAGIADLIVRKKDGTTVIVELKSNKLKRSNVNQLKRYIDWWAHKREKVEGILIGWDSSSSVESLIRKLTKKGYSIRTLIYDAKLRLREP